MRNEMQLALSAAPHQILWSCGHPDRHSSSWQDVKCTLPLLASALFETHLAVTGVSLMLQRGAHMTTHCLMRSLLLAIVGSNLLIGIRHS